MQTYGEAFAHGERLMDAGQYDQASNVFEAILEAAPCNPEAVAMVGAIMCNVGKPCIGVALNTFAFQRNPENYKIAANLAACLREARMYDDAIAIGTRILEIIPDADKKTKAETLGNIAGAYINLGNPWPGIKFGKQGIEIAERAGIDTPLAHNNLGILMLEAGQWAAGWKHYSHRLKVNKEGYKPRNYPGKEWDGKRVGRLVIHGEQGLGDELMFLGCVPDVLSLASQITLEVAPKLKTLVARSFPDCEVIGSQEEFKGDADAWCPMGNLPSLFRNGVPPKRSGYIKPNEGLVEMWREYLGDGPSVLMAFRGGTPKTHEGLRNPPLEAWKAVVDACPKAYSIQYGDGGPAMADALGVEHLSAVAGEMENTAACLVASSGLVSPQQTALHMAGAVGVRCIGVVSSRPAWRYGVSGPMPWYETVELVRAKEKKTEAGKLREDWESTMRTVAEKVRSWS